MDPFSAFAVFVIIWWTVIFCVLPFGIKTDIQAGTGAPLKTGLRKKFIITTGISFLLWLLVYGLIKSEIVNFRQLSQRMIEEDSK